VISDNGNAFMESSNGGLRDELLNETLFPSLAKARVALGDWRVERSSASRSPRPLTAILPQIEQEGHSSQRSCNFGRLDTSL
jgi:hypothetical protein